jgi:hypothetical protein
VRRIRISLRGLLLLVTALGLFLGFNTYRRQGILTKAEYFEKYDVLLVVPSAFIDYLWQRRPDTALISLPSEKYAKNEVMVHRELAKVGIEEPTIVFGVETNWDDAMDVE